MDSGFPTLKLTRDLSELWRTKMIATQRGNTAHMPRNHKANLKDAKNFVRAFSKTLHNENVTGVIMELNLDKNIGILLR